MTCPDDIVEGIELGDSGVIVTFANATAVDASGVTTLQSQSHFSGTFFPVGETTVTYTFVDSSNNIGICSFTISVITGKLEEKRSFL